MCKLELETNLREVWSFTIMDKDSTWALICKESSSRRFQPGEGPLWLWNFWLREGLFPALVQTNINIIGIQWTAIAPPPPTRLPTAAAQWGFACDKIESGMVWCFSLYVLWANRVIKGALWSFNDVSSIYWHLHPRYSTSRNSRMDGI